MYITVTYSCGFTAWYHEGGKRDTVEQTDIYTYQSEIDVRRSDETINLRNPV